MTINRLSVGSALIACLLCQTSCSEERNLGSFTPTENGGQLQARLPHRLAGWNLWLRHATPNPGPETVVLTLTNLGQGELYVKVGQLRQDVSQGRQVTVFEGSPEDALQTLNVFLGSNGTEIEVELSLKSERSEQEIEAFSFVAYTSDGP